MKKTLLAAFFLVLCIAVFFYIRQIAEYRTPRRLVEKLPMIAQNLEFQLDNVRYTHTRSGQKKWELTARKAIRHKHSLKIVLEQVEAWIYPTGKLKNATHITAQQGTYQVKSGDIFLQGSIRIVNPEFTISTTRVIYNESAGTIIAPGGISLQNPKFNMTAGRCLIVLDAHNLQCSHGVKTVIHPGNTTQNNHPQGAHE